jgi:transcriptional regulator with GAF, ATPase, and Fis domain
MGSVIVLRLSVEGDPVGAIDISSCEEDQYIEAHAKLLAHLNDPLAIALSNSLRYREVLEMQRLLADDKRYLENELRETRGREVIGADFGLRSAMDLVRQVAPTSSPVLLLGETGTGKEVVAGAVHQASRRQEGPFIKLNCGAIPQSLMDSELFGHEKGGL